MLVLIYITGLEAVWHLGRTVYDALPDPESVATALFETASEMTVMYFGYASILTSVTAMARATADTSIGTYIKLVSLAVFCSIAVMEIALIVVHWKGPEGAKRLFTRMKTIVDSKGKNVEAIVGKEQSQ
jgi:hypothetical protein